MGPSAEVHCAARAAERVQRSRNAFSSITMTKPVACPWHPPLRTPLKAQISSCYLTRYLVFGMPNQISIELVQRQVGLDPTSGGVGVNETAKNRAGA